LVLVNISHSFGPLVDRERKFPLMVADIAVKFARLPRAGDVARR